ncbi:caspase family protein [Lacibacter luteus]|uniref:Caspase family protein n=1 Tax=Lacibacter luteus TaxID=2508719 RepID=A0A4Q1CIV7_9BACT|nr:caspase family protein [Lacibacter luteus]RXK60034.1 caspase family protein [Lacibacter luteus]
MRRALVVGINNYPTSPLRACINDASAFGNTIETHGDGDPNFAVMLRTDVPTKGQLSELVDKLFNCDDEVALFYFSGHGFENDLGTYLVTPDASKNDVGLSMTDLLVMANKSKAKNRVIILDCCHSGAAGTSPITGGSITSINTGVTILTASKSDEAAIEVNGHGVFTNLLLDALQGGAADIRGEITPGSIYAYIDQALGIWDQRPVFKTNITEFISLRKINAKVPKETLRKITKYFKAPEEHFPLDPSYEDTNSEEVKHELVQPYADENNVAVFKDLQKFQSVGLVVPVDAPYMYFAAMESKACRLTALGYHYWRLVQQKKI